MGAGDEGLVETIFVKFQALQESLESLRADSLRANEILASAREKNKESEKSSWEVTLLAQEAYQEARLGKSQTMLLRENQYELEKWSKVRKMLDEATDLSKEKYAAMSKHAEENMAKSRAAIDNLRQGFSELGDKMDETAQKQKGFFASMNELGNSVGINIPGAVTGGAIVAGAFSVLSQGQQNDLNRSKFEAMRGQGMSDGEFGQYSGLRNDLTSQGFGKPNISKEEFDRVSQMVMSRGGTSSGQAFGPNGLVRTALMAAPGAGVSPDRAVEHFNTMMTQLNIPVSKVSEEFTKLVGTAYRLHDASGRSIEATMGLAKNFAAYNLDIDTAGRMVRSFWQEIKEGKMSMEDLNKVMGVGGKMSQGQLAYVGSEILGKDQNFSKFFSGENGLGASTVMKRLLTGDALLGEGNVSKKDLNKRRDDAIQSIFKKAQEMGNASGGTAAEKEGMTSMFLQSFSGLNFGNMSRGQESKLLKELAAGGGLTKDSTEAMRLAGKDPSIAELERVGEDIRKLGTDPLQNILNELKNISKLLGGGIVYLGGWLATLTGHPMTGEDIRRNALQIMGDTPAGRALGINSEPGVDTTKETIRLDSPYRLKHTEDAIKNAHFKRPEEFGKFVEGLYKNDPGKGNQKSLEEFLRQGSLKTDPINGTVYFDFGDLLGEYAVRIQDGKVVETPIKTRAAKPAMVKN